MEIVLKVVADEKDKQEFIDKFFSADIELKQDKKMGNKIISLFDRKKDKLYIFRKSSEGYVNLSKNFESVNNVEFTPKTFNDMMFFGEVAKLIEGEG